MDYLSARFAKIDDAAAELGTQLVALVGEKQVAKKTAAAQTQPQPQPQPQSKTPSQPQTAAASNAKPPTVAPTTAQPPQQPAVAEEKAVSAETIDGASTEPTGRPSTEETTATASSSAATTDEAAAGEGKEGNAA